MLKERSQFGKARSAVAPAISFSILVAIIVVAVLVGNLTDQTYENCEPVGSQTDSATVPGASILVWSSDANQLLLCNTGTPTTSSSADTQNRSASVNRNGPTFVQREDRETTQSSGLIYRMGEGGNVYDCYRALTLDEVLLADVPRFSHSSDDRYEGLLILGDFDPSEIVSCEIYTEHEEING